MDVSVFIYQSFKPQGHCYLWQFDILWTSVISDGVMALSCFSILLALLFLNLKRKDPTYQWVLLLFGLSIGFCGVTHAISIYTVWTPSYGLEMFFKAATALTSLITALSLWFLTPTLLKTPIPNQIEAKNRQLQQLNESLKKRVEDSVQESFHLATIINQSVEGIISVDLQGKIATWNFGAEKMFQFKAEECIGNPVTMLLPSNRFFEHKNVVSKILKGQLLNSLDTVRRRKDGSEIFVELSFFPFLNKANEVIGYTIAARDFSKKSLINTHMGGDLLLN